MKRTALLAAILLLASAGAANGQHNQGGLDVGPGMISAESSLYGLEVAWDNAKMGLGIAKPGTVAQERAAEARTAMEHNNTRAAQRAADEMGKVAQRATSEDTEGLEKAAAVLQAVRENAPAAAQQGLQTALNSVRQAQQRIPSETPAGPGASEGNASAKMAQARDLMEQGRQDLADGNDAMDNGNYQAAANEFGQAEQAFTDAINLVQDLDTPEAADLEQRLRNAKQTAQDARSSAQQQDSAQGGGQQ